MQPAVAVVAAVALGGCAALAPPPSGTLFERGGVSVLAIPDTVRETYFNDPQSAERHCRAPSADSVVAATDSISLDAPTAAAAAASAHAISLGASNSALALGGRNPAVLIARELLYRACELTSNLDLPPDKTLAVYERFLLAIERISEKQTGAGSLPMASAPPPPSGDGVDSDASEPPEDTSDTPSADSSDKKK